MTSNLVGAEIAKHARNPEPQEEEVRKVLHNSFRPELLNRIDEIITFQHLTQEEPGKIVELQMNLVGERLSKKNISNGNLGWHRRKGKTYSQAD